MDGVDKDSDDLNQDHFEIAKERFTSALEYYSTEYDRGEADAVFAMGDQWEEEERARRRRDCRPCLTENQCMPMIESVVNAAREMRPSVRVSPVDDQGDIDTAKVFKGLVRNIERQSTASVAYDWAVQNSVMSGYGWLHVTTRYTDPMSFDQELRIEGVPDWRSVMIDSSSTELDGSDAEYGFIYRDIEKDVFEADYPDEVAQDFEGAELSDDDKVRVVDYYFKDYEETTIYECFMVDGSVQILTDAQKNDAGAYIQTVLQERSTKIPSIKWLKMHGGGILKETEWLGQYIPLVPVYGKRVWEDDRLKSYSLIHQAKDPQRMANIVETTIAEIIGSQPKNQPYIGVEGQFDNDERWENANTENYANLTYKGVTIHDETTGQSFPAPPPQKSQPLMISPVLFQIKESAVAGVSRTLGMYEENRGDQSNAISGVAIQSRQVRGDRATFHFPDNLATSIRQVGLICIDVIPKLYKKKQVLRIIGVDDKEETIIADPNAQTDKTAGIYNLHVGKYDVDADVGPSYANQQQEFLNISTELMRANPAYADIAGDKIVESAGGPYAEVIADRMRANMPPEMQSDDPMAAKLMEVAKQLDAATKENETLMIALENKDKNEQAELSLKGKEVEIKANDSQTKRLETMAKIEQMRLQAQGAEGEALADIAEAVMEVNDRSDQTEQVLSVLLERLEALPLMNTQGDPAAI